MEPIPLDYPIQFEGRLLDEISLRRPKVSDVRQAREKHKGDVAQEVALIAALSGLPASAIEDLDIEDYGKLQKVVQGFFGSNEETA